MKTNQTGEKKPSSFAAKIDKFFKISERGSSFKTEVTAGLTTFFAMAYIVMVNPNSVAGDALALLSGELRTIWLSVYVASLLVAVVGTLLYAFYAKLPFAQACGMGLNSFFFVSFILPQLLGGGSAIEGYREGLCIILLSGVLFLILSITGARQYIAKALPDCLKKAIPAGIGLFIALIGFKNAGIIQDNQYTFVQFFDFHTALFEPADYAVKYWGMSADAAASVTILDTWRSAVAPVVFAIIGLLLIAILNKKNVKGSIIISIISITVAYYLATWQLPSFDLGNIGESFSAFGKEGFLGAFKGFGIFAGGATAIINAIVLTITFTLVDMFDTIGTLYGTASQADMLDENGDPININESMASDSIATVSGALLGTSTCTTFVESASGVAAGGRTGLASLITSICFFACLFLSPVAAIVPSCATAPALIFVGVLMLKNFSKVNMEDMASAVPAFLALVMMPLTYSISNGIAIGALAYTVITAITGKFKKKDIVVAIIAALFVARFILVTM